MANTKTKKNLTAVTETAHGSDDKRRDKKEKMVYNCGKVTGPVQFLIAESVDPVQIQDLAITRTSVSGEDRANQQIEKSDVVTGEMGSKYLITYGLYTTQGWIDPYWAAKTGFTYADMKLLLNAMFRCFELGDRSASRGHMSMRAVYLFEHDGKLGNAPDHVLFNAIKISRQNPENGRGPREFGDYSIDFDHDAVPKPVKAHVLNSVSDVDNLKLPNKGIVDKRYDAYIIFDCRRGNPNGDPDANNEPRQDCDGFGLVSDVCFKRKIRNAVTRMTADNGAQHMFFSSSEDMSNVLSSKQKQGYDECGLTEKLRSRKGGPTREEIELAKKKMCELYWDVRTFGAILSTGKCDKETADDGDEE